MSPESEQAPRPWYRQLWPWLLMLPPGASVLAGAAMLYLVVHEPTVLVVDDYSRIEALTSERFARDSLAAKLGLSAELSFEPAADGRTRVTVELEGPPGFVPPAALSLSLRHAADPLADRKVALARQSAAGFDGDVALAAGRYDLELEPADATWRLAGALFGVPGRQRLRAQDTGD